MKFIFIFTLLALVSCGKSAMDAPQASSKPTENLSTPLEQIASPISCNDRCLQVTNAEFYRIQKLGPQSLTNGFCPEGSDCASTPKLTQEQFNKLVIEFDRTLANCKSYCDFCISKNWSKESIFKSTPGEYSCRLDMRNGTKCGPYPESKAVACDPNYLDGAINLYGYF